MQPGNTQLAVRQGDTLSLTITLSNPAAGAPTTPGAPLDLTGAAAQFLIRNQLTVTSAAPTANGSSLLLGGIAGTLSLTLSSADTDTLKTGAFDLRVRFASGVTQTYLTGNILVSAEAAPWQQAQ